MPATVHYRVLSPGNRELKFVEFSNLHLGDPTWVDGPREWRAPFMPPSQGAWSTYPTLLELATYNGSGVQPGRTWVIAPDLESLEKRWRRLMAADPQQKEKLFHPHLREGVPGDRHSNKVMKASLYGFPVLSKSVADTTEKSLEPVMYGYRSFDRQWIIPDIRIINQPNPHLWKLRGNSQIFLTALLRSKPTSGPAITFTAGIPDYDHYRGSFGGRVIPLWADETATTGNISPRLLGIVSDRLGSTVTSEDFFAYIAAIAANPAYTARFQGDLSTPGLRIPVTADAALFCEASGI